MDPVEIVSKVLAETKWHPGCPPEYLPALARDILHELESDRLTVVALPVPDDGYPEDLMRWVQDDWFVGIDTSPGSARGEVNQHAQPWLSANDARAYAAALIAAANLSEAI